jgi:arylsulfatase A-like enzyme
VSDRRTATAVASVVLAMLVGACSSRKDAKPREEPVSPTSRPESAPVPAPPARGAPPQAVVIDIADPKAPCVFGYHGPVLDLSTPLAAAELGWKLRPASVEWIEHEGSSWAAIHGNSVAVDFFVVLPVDVMGDGPLGGTPFVQARLRGGAARSVSFYLNGHAIGSASVRRGETRIVAIKGAAALPVSGSNELTLRFSGVAKASTEPSLEIEWVHLGVGEPDPLYAAPIRKDSWVSRSFAGQPARALSLRGPGFARCEGWLPAGSVVEARASLEGAGAADAEIRVVRDRVPPTVIGTMHLDATDTSARVRTWPVGDIGVPGTLGAIELSVVRATKGARVVFGEPRVLAPSAAPAPPPSPASPPAHGVVLVVMSQVGARSLAPYGGTLATPAITQLAASGVIFDASRATTGVSNGAVGSMLTGLSARDLGTVDGDSRLPRGATTVADAVGQAGIASAFFTANPLTSSGYGFDRGWSHFEAAPPTDEAPAARVFDAAIRWLDEHHKSPFLLVIHARGGHPPWDVPLEKIKGLPPEGYTGGLDARHAGELLGRSARTPGSYRFDDADRARAGALYTAALEAEDEGFGRLMRALRASGDLDSTTVILTSDVGLNEGARIPFAESESLEESALTTPLIARWAHEPPSGRHVPAATTSEDIASTVLAAFGLPAPVTFRGKDLHALADGAQDTPSRPLLAADQDRFSLRWGAFVSSGVRDRETKLCDLSLEAACVTDVRESYPLASRLLHQNLFRGLVESKPSFAREPAALDPAMQAALKAWGR